MISVFGWAFLDPQFSIFGFGRFLSEVFLGQHLSGDSALSENQMEVLELNGNLCQLIKILIVN